MNIRRAEIRDIPGINKMLYQVNNVHEAIRSDIFVKDCKKYNDEELADIIRNDMTPVFVAVDEYSMVMGYCFCVYQIQEESENMRYRKVIYIDDLCVDETLRGRHVGEELYKYVTAAALENSCSAITLNVWEGNDPARRFYEKHGFKPLKTTMEVCLTDH